MRQCAYTSSEYVRLPPCGRMHSLSEYAALSISKFIKKLQNPCMLFSFNIDFINHITQYLNENSILSMFNKHTYHIFSFIYRVIKTGDMEDISKGTL